MPFTRGSNKTASLVWASPQSERAGRVAQLAEPPDFNSAVAGSSPAAPIILARRTDVVTMIFMRPFY